MFDSQIDQILSVHTTSEGLVAYVSCPDGRIVVEDYERLNPYSWRNSSSRRRDVPAAA